MPVRLPLSGGFRSWNSTTSIADMTVWSKKLLVSIMQCVEQCIHTGDGACGVLELWPLLTCTGKVSMCLRTTSSGSLWTATPRGRSYLRGWRCVGCADCRKKYDNSSLGYIVTFKQERSRQVFRAFSPTPGCCTNVMSSRWQTNNLHGQGESVYQTVYMNTEENQRHERRQFFTISHSRTTDRESQYAFYNLQGITEVQWRPPLQQDDWMTLVQAIYTVPVPDSLRSEEPIVGNTSGCVTKQGSWVKVFAEMMHLDSLTSSREYLPTL